MSVYVKYLPIGEDEEIQNGMFILNESGYAILIDDTSIDVASVKLMPSIINKDGSLKIAKPYAVTNKFDVGDEVFCIESDLNTRTIIDNEWERDACLKSQEFYRVLKEIPSGCAPSKDFSELDPEMWHLSSMAKLRKYLHREGVSI